VHRGVHDRGRRRDRPLSTPFERRVETGEDPATLEQRAGELAPGAPMRWRHYDGETSLALLSGSGLEIERAETRTTSGNESWLWVLSRKGG
jgi:hypothetical protein